MPCPPSRDVPEASSSTAAEKAFSSLRARLRSEDIPPSQEPSAPTNSRENRVYAKLQAIFSQDLAAHADSSTHQAATDLAETFALYGQEVYNLSLQTVQAAHEATSAKISAFHAQAASTSAHATQLYNNISYPVSATLCRSETFPSASLGRHIRALHKRLSAVEAELGTLNEEWERCVGEETLILSERADAVGGGEDSRAAGKKMEELVARVDDIVRRRGEEIDELNEEYRGLLWAESNRMMRAMMAD
ncbi:hypothetical protein E4U42_003578 [Claviceps africana]|uniref:Uncharacterized protein n=1 Tax=Claviceps africana TaxID=83212 RepID=A0A8K0J6K8_9HYPO|nr:hypothetical protein E4U42_003578 [Claviceps africana]